VGRKRDRVQHVIILKWWRANPGRQVSYISVVQDQNGADTKAAISKAAEVTEITNGSTGSPINPTPGEPQR
jgi:hypothetical protein